MKHGRYPAGWQINVVNDTSEPRGGSECILLCTECTLATPHGIHTEQAPRCHQSIAERELPDVSRSGRTVIEVSKENYLVLPLHKLKNGLDLVGLLFSNARKLWRANWIGMIECIPCMMILRSMFSKGQLTIIQTTD